METIIALIMALVSGLTAIMKTIAFVQEGERGIRLRFGKAERDKNGKPIIIDPGFILMIPFVDTLRRHHVRQSTVDCGDQRIMLKDGLIFIVDAIVIFRVTDIYRALFEIINVDGSIASLAGAILREELATRNHNDLNDATEISQKLLARIKERAAEWGVEFIDFKLINCAPTAETALLVNVEVGISMRITALKNAAEKLGVKVENIPPQLAAVMIGAPLVASVQTQDNDISAPTNTAETEQ